MKRILSLIIAVFTCSVVLFAQQAKKPKLMVVPSDAWCIEKGYVQTYDNMGMTQTIPNYSAALNNKELNNVISKLNILMADRAFPMQDLGQTIKSINNISAEDMLITSSTSGAAMTESPLDRVRRVAKADIILEIYWSLNSIGPRNSITYNLKALDVYTNKQVAGAQGTGIIAGGSVRPVLELAGYKDINSKVIGTNNPRNVVNATINGLASLKRAEEVAKLRGKTVEEILG